MILVDTHIVIWLAEAPEELSSRAHDAIREERRRDGLAISDKTLWELAMLIANHRVGVKTSMLEFLQEVERNFNVIPVSAAIAERAMRLSKRYFQDPADRIIGATAIIQGLRLVTKDAGIRRAGDLETVW